MSVIPTGLAGALAGAPLAQTKGSEIERAQQDMQVSQRHAKSQARTADALEVAAADGEDTKAEDRDADGRRFWERPARQRSRRTRPWCLPPRTRSKTRTAKAAVNSI